MEKVEKALSSDNEIESRKRNECAKVSIIHNISGPDHPMDAYIEVIDRSLCFLWTKPST